MINAIVKKADAARAAAAKAAVVPHAAAKPVAVAPTAAVPTASATVPPRPVAAAVPPAAAPILNRPPMRPSFGQIGRPAFPVTNGAHAPVTAPVAAKAAVVDTGPKKPVLSRHGFKTGEMIVYPAHGVGRIIAIEEQEIANMSLELFVIQFEKDKMTLRVPTGKATHVGMRKLAEDGIVKRAMETLKGKARIKRTMWSRRAQEFETKINSGDLIQIAEVVRDLFRADNQPEQSYSERQLYEAALDRMGREIAAVEKTDERGAVQRITEVLSKSAKGRRAAADEAAAATAGDDASKAA